MKRLRSRPGTIAEAQRDRAEMLGGGGLADARRQPILNDRGYHDGILLVLPCRILQLLGGTSDGAAELGDSRYDRIRRVGTWAGRVQLAVDLGLGVAPYPRWRAREPPRDPFRRYAVAALPFLARRPEIEGVFCRRAARRP
jgi:hypothetical protein